MTADSNVNTFAQAFFNGQAFMTATVEQTADAESMFNGVGFLSADVITA